MCPSDSENLMRTPTDRQLPPLNRVRVFEAAARHSSFAAAAVELNITRGAVSQSVQALEKFFGRKLFIRGAQRLDLTDAGRKYMARLGPALDEIAAATDEFLDAEAGPRPIVIGAVDGVLQRWLLPLWAEAHTEMPQIAVQLVSTSENANLDTYDCDAIVSTDGFSSPGLCCEGLIEVNLFPVASVSFLQRVGLPHTVSELLDLPLMYTSSRPDDWCDWLSTAGIASPVPELMPDRQFDSMGTLIDAARAGMGVAVIFDCLIEHELANQELIPLFPDVPAQTCQFDLIYPVGKMGRPVFRQFRDLLVSRCSTIYE